MPGPAQALGSGLPARARRDQDQSAHDGVILPHRARGHLEELHHRGIEPIARPPVGEHGTAEVSEQGPNDPPEVVAARTILAECLSCVSARSLLDAESVNDVRYQQLAEPVARLVARTLLARMAKEVDR